MIELKRMEQTPARLVRMLQLSAMVLLASSASSLALGQDRKLSGPEVEIVTITNGGMWPEKIVRKAGPFLLVVRNLSTNPNDDLELATESGVLQRAIAKGQDNSKRARTELVLPVGRYELRSKNQAKAKLSLVIE